MKSKTKDKEKIKLIIYKTISLISSILGILCAMLLFLFDALEFNKYICWTCDLLGVLFFSLAIIFYFLTDKQKRKVMNNSMKYYKQRLPFCGIQVIIIVICAFFSFILGLENNNINYDILLTIAISLTSLNFLVLTFIVPYMKTRIDQLMKKTTSKHQDTKGKVYHTIQKYNQSYVIVFISVILFFVYMFSNLVSSQTLINFYLLTSLIYSAYVLISLMISIKTIFWINLKDVENKLEKYETKK